ncbi:solanesyl-diphosphate synthase 2, chloroplastic-like isoform X1 [Zingiber officinale]|uniref:solanesyl-diphosphate synthase 2, chloroplastic-like isoform X1 n=1 Tax=Zingiber officinale TaxID=94328 RepID=UPI001C4C401E|nr:solanesyl-diphosphate synthase 2, chloroplastic-like isoform X1 [Zingiber officinale]
MLSLTCPSVDLSQSGCLGRRRVRPPWRSSAARSVGARCMVSTTQDVDVRSGGVATSVKPAVSSSGSIQVSSLLEVVSADIKRLNENLKALIGAENPVLVSAAEQIFGAGGKRLRPALVFLVSRATAQIAGLKELTVQHRRLAEIIEMIHTASLIHDDVIDDSGIRRGKETVHQIYGTRVAVLAGDFMFAQSSWYLANLENIEVIKLISQVIKDFASGEIKQASSLFNCDATLEDYLLKSYYKTASLVASSSKSASIFSGVNIVIGEQMYEYGKNLGLSFQIVDDILDFTQSTEQLGKPACSDLSKGNLTAPVIFALEKEPKLRKIIDSEFSENGSFDAAIELIHQSGGLKMAQELAKQKAEVAIGKLECLPESEFKNSLEGIVKYNLERID